MLKTHKKGIKSRKHTRSLKGSFTVSFLLLLTAVVITIAYYSYGILYKELSLYKENFVYNTENASDKLFSLIDSSIDATKLAGYSVSCQRFLLSDTPSVIIDSMQTLNDVMNYSALYIDEYTDMVFVSDIGRQYSQNSNYDILNEVLENEGLSTSYIFNKAHFAATSDGKYLVYLIPVKGIIDGHRFGYNQIIGSVIFSTDKLLKRAQLAPEYEGEVYLFCNGELLGSTAAGEVNASELLAKNEGLTSAKKKGQTVYYNKITFEKYNLSLVYSAPSKLRAENTYNRDRLLILFVIFFMLLIVVLMVSMIKNVEKSVLDMKEDIIMAEHELHPVRRPDIEELQVVSDVINNTFTALNKSYARETRLIQDNYEALLAQTRAELLAYRNQINPHFLFNTLETARSLSHHYGAEQVEELISGMSKLFRYALYTSSEVTVADEISNLKAYMSVMDIRFPSRYKLKIRVAEELMELSVMSMLLQPIVENTIKHAFAGKMNACILVRVKECDNSLLITVADNGHGISDEKISEIMANCDAFRNQYSEETTYGKQILMDSSVEDKSIGIINIFRRLIITYGEKATLDIRSRSGFYTVITIKIPKKRRDRT